MTFWALSALINAISATGFGFFVYINNRKNPVNISWGTFSLTIAFWSYCYFFWQISTDESHALFWCRILTFGSVFIPVAFLHFLLIWLEQYKQEKKLLYVCYAVTTIGFLLNFTPLIVHHVSPAMVFKYWPRAGVAYLPFLVFWVWIVIYCWRLMFRTMYTASPIRRNQIMYILIAAVIGFSGGLTNFPLWFDIKILPVGNALVSVYVALMAYAIVRHQLMDIEVVIKKTLIFASLFAIVFGIFVGITILTQEIIAGGRLLGLGISAVVIIFAVRPLEDFLIKITDKYLFQKKYDYKQVLKSFIDEVITDLDLNQIIKKTLDLLDKMFHPEKAAILLLNSEEDRYVSYGNFGYDKDMALEGNSRIPLYLKEKKNIILEEEGLVIPLMIHNELIGIMLLGKKRSDIPYTKEDLDILTDLAQTEATAISNSRTHILLLQAKEKEQQTEHLVSLAFVVTNISHELRNPIQIILTAAETTLDAIDAELDIGALDEKSKNTVSYIKSKLKTIMEKSDKTNEMLNSILHSLKITPGNFIFLSLKEIAAEAISRVEPYLEPISIKIMNNIPDDFPKIKGDRITLEQVFVNLLTNAMQAIEFAKKGDKIDITALDMDDKVRLEMSDNGPGIPEQDIRRIFEPFYTTKDNLYSYKSGKSKGVGLGLMIVYQTITRHEGAIYVRSKVGEGTTFVIDLPKRV